MSAWSGLAGRYRVEWSGRIAPASLTCEEDPTARARLDADDSRAIEEMIARRRAAGQVILQAAGGGLPPLYRLCAFTGTKNGLVLRLGRTDYGEYLHTNVEHPERRAERGDAAMSDALAVCAALVTADGRVVYGPRSARIPDAQPLAGARRFHVLPSGHPEPPGGLVAGLLQELWEEAAIRRDEVTRMQLTGLVRALPSGKPELTFLLETSVAFADISARAARDAWEFESLEGFPWTRSGAASWLTLHREDAVPPGHAAVALAARSTFGQDVWPPE